MRPDRSLRVAGFALGIFDPTVTGEEIRWGNNVVPTFVVDDVDALHARLLDRQVDVVLPLQEVNGTRLFQCRVAHFQRLTVLLTPDDLQA